MSEESLRQCGFCGIENTTLRFCAACRAVRYCNTEHQKKHWRTHKPICHQLNSSKGAIRKNRRNSIPSSKVKSMSENVQEDSINLDKSLLDPVLRDQVYPNGRIPIYSEPDLSTPIESEMGVHSGVRRGSQSNQQSLYQLASSPDNHFLIEPIIPDWLSNVTSLVIRDLNVYGFCAVDNFLGKERALKVLSEVTGLHSRGTLSDGQVVSQQVRAQAMGMIRGDKITWVSGSEKGCEAIGQLISTVDSVIMHANKHQEAGKLSDYNITFRTRAMVACYPGGGTRYVKHIDNPNGDGRCVTAIYYINENWQPSDGGVLRIYPQGLGDLIGKIDPIFDRMLFFWSDRRNPHEVMPSTSTRYAITVWYLDQHERDKYLSSLLR